MLSAKLFVKKKTENCFHVSSSSSLPNTLLYSFILAVLITLYSICGLVWGFDVDIKFCILIWGKLKMMDRIDIEKFLLVL